MNRKPSFSATPLRAIREMCLRCKGGDAAVVAGCASTDCPLRMFRRGRKPTAAELRRNVAANPLCDLQNAPDAACRHLRRCEYCGRVWHLRNSDRPCFGVMFEDRKGVPIA